MADKVRMAFVGLGRWSDMLADGALRSGRVEIAGGLSRSGEKKAAFSEKYGGAPLQSYEEILASDSVDAVVLTTPNSLHVSQAAAAARAGKHIFVEKPMALSVADCKKMIAAAEAAGVTLAVGQNTRRMVRYRKAAELIREGAVGEVVLVEGNMSKTQGYRLTPKLWRWSREESPGGPLVSFTVHQADSFNYLIGPIHRVSAFTKKLSGPAPPDDVMAAVVEFKSGALGYLGGTMLTGTRNFTQIHGTEGNVLVDEMGSAAFYQKKGSEEFERFPMPDHMTQLADSLAEEMDEFAACIQEGAKPEVGGEEGMAAVAVIEAILRSAEADGPVNLDDFA
ncbi:MAG: Gfo/Idh/MocA family oxidoreductase [bacterium]|nr:Gfo/Idh/MocA family oxidoreductase [bacterium]